MKNRKNILQQLEDVPHILSYATEAWLLHPDDAMLNTAVQNLYHIVVDCVSGLIRILLRTKEGSSCEST